MAGTHLSDVSVRSVVGDAIYASFNNNIALLTAIAMSEVHGAHTCWHPLMEDVCGLYMV